MTSRIWGIAAGLAGMILTGHAQAQVVVTSITSSFPDSAGKVPKFNAVPGAAIATWSIGLAQGVLTHGQSYNTCVSLASSSAAGKATVSFKLARGATTIQSAVIVPASKFPVAANSVYYLCGGYRVLPNNPGLATLTGIVAFTATGATRPVVSHASVQALLQ